MSKILITGATGNFGKATIAYLLEKGINPNDISALVRDEEKATDLKQKGVDVIPGDYDDYISLAAAFKGVDKLLFISGSDMANRISQHENIVAAAKKAGVKHIIYTSAIPGNKSEKSAIDFVHHVHIQTERWLEESGVPYTFMRNAL